MESRSNSRGWTRIGKIVRTCVVIDASTPNGAGRRVQGPIRELARVGPAGLESHSESQVPKGVARSGRVMELVSQSNSYQCDRCGTTNVVAAPVLFEQGTRTYSGRLSSGTTQTFAAQAAAPPRPRGYLRPFLTWGSAIAIFFAWSVAGISSIREHPLTSALHPSAVAVFLALGVASLMGMLSSLRKRVRHNREIYPQLRWNWEHTYICRRCGKNLLIPY